MKKIFSIWFLTILLVNTSCEKWFAPKESSPSIGQILAKEITTTSATVEVTIDAIGISKTTDFGFCYSTNKDAKITDNKISLGTVYSASKAQTFTSKLSQLKTGTTYYVNVYASNKKTTIYGKSEINFNTLSLTPPKVSISDATDVKFNSFNISGQITDLGTSSVSEFGHTLSETIKEPTTADLVTKLGSANSAPKDFKSAFTSLKASTTYYVRSYAINSTGTSYSDVKTIKTSALELPKVTTETFSNITFNSAKISGRISEQGTNPVTDLGHVLSKSNQIPTTSDTKTSLGAQSIFPKDFISSFSGLEANATYYCRAYAISEAGIAYGEVKSFKTLNLLPPTVTTISAIANSTSTGALQGKINALGTATSITDYGFCYSLTNQEPTIADTKKGLGTTTNGSLDFKTVIENLKANTLYYVRAYATSKDGIAYGEVKNFKTLNLQPPTVTTITSIANSISTATAQGKINALGTATSITDYGFCYSLTNQEPTIADTKKGLGTTTNGSLDFKTVIENLKVNTLYYVRAYATSKDGIAYGEVKSFKTLNLQPPTVTTTSVVANSISTATAQGKINSLGTATTITDYGFCYSLTNQEPTITDTKKGLGTTTNGNLDFKAGIDNLKANTTYYIRAYAASKDGIAYGEVKSFKTLNLQPPTVTTISAIANSISTATAQGKINSLGTAMSITDYGFCYSITNQEPTVSDTKKGLGTTTNGSLDFKTSIDNLKANTLYYVRAYALSQDGVGYGEVKSFKTLNEVPPTISAVQMLSDKRCEFDFNQFNTTPVYNDPCKLDNYVSNGLRDGFKFGFSFQKNTNGEIISNAGIEIISNVFVRGTGFSPGSLKTVVNKVESGGKGAFLSIFPKSSSFVAYLDISIATGNTKSVNCGPQPANCGILGCNGYYGIQTAKEFKTENFFIYPYQNSQLILAKQSTKFKFKPYVITTSGKVYYGTEVEIDPIEYDCRGPGRQ